MSPAPVHPRKRPLGVVALAALGLALGLLRPAPVGAAPFCSPSRRLLTTGLFAPFDPGPPPRGVTISNSLLVSEPYPGTLPSGPPRERRPAGSARAAARCTPSRGSVIANPGPAPGRRFPGQTFATSGTSLTPVSYPAVTTGGSSIRFLPPAAVSAPLQSAHGSAPTPVPASGLPGSASPAGGQATPAGVQGTVVHTSLTAYGPAPSSTRRAAEQDEQQRRQALAELRRLRDELRNEKGSDGTREEAVKALERTIEAIENGPAPARPGTAPANPSE